MQGENQLGNDNDSQSIPPEEKYPQQKTNQQDLQHGQLIEYLPQKPNNQNWQGDPSAYPPLGYHPQPPKSNTKTIIIIVCSVLAFLIIVGGVLAALVIPIYGGIVDDSKWSEGKTAVGCIKTAVDVYLASNNDFSEFELDSGDEFPDKTAIEFWEAERNLGMSWNSLVNLQYFMESDFIISVDKTLDEPTYNIWVKTSETGNSPSSEGFAYRGMHKNGTTVTWWKSANAPEIPTELPEVYAPW